MVEFTLTYFWTDPYSTDLNSFARSFLLGPLAGITRVALAILHIIGHAFAALIYWNKGHLFHAVKGGAELLRGLIETVPFIGAVFTRVHDVDLPGAFMYGVGDVYRRSQDYDVKSYFLIEITKTDGTPFPNTTPFLNPVCEYFTMR